MDYYAILTNAGLAAIANAPVTGVPLTFTKFAAGDGGGEEYAPQADQPALKNKCWEGAVTSVRINADNPNLVEVRAVIPSSVGGFVVRELGLLNENGTLVAVANCPPTSKVLMSDGVTSEMEVGMQILVSSTENISLTVDPTVILVTQKMLDSAMDTHNADPGAHTGLITAHNSDPGAHGGGTVCTLAHSKSGTVHAFTGLGERIGLVPCQFKAAAGYTAGDTATIDGEAYTIQLTGADAPETDLFVSGKSILVDVDTEGKTINFKAGGGLTKAKLALATATEAEVFVGKTFYAGGKTLRTGTALSEATDVAPKNLFNGKKAYTNGGKLVTGTALSTATDVAAGNLFNGKKAYDNNGNLVTGTALSQAVNVNANNIPSGVTAYNQAGQRITGNGSQVFKYETGSCFLNGSTEYISCDFTIKVLALYGGSWLSDCVQIGNGSTTFYKCPDSDFIDQENYQGTITVSGTSASIWYNAGDGCSIYYVACGV